MEDKKDQKMTEKRDIPFIELSWNDQEDLLSLADSEQFKDVILKESYKSIMYSLKNNLCTRKLNFPPNS